MFVGLAILATEFEWAQRALLRLHPQRYDAVDGVVPRPGDGGCRHSARPLTAVVVVATLWVFGVLGWTASMLGYERAWLNSPIGLGS